MDPDVLWDRAIRRRRRRRTGTALGAAALLVGAATIAGAIGSSDPSVETGVAHEGDSEGCDATTDDLIAPSTDVIITLEPHVTASRIDEEVAAIRSIPAVDDVIVVSQNELYERYRQVHAQVPGFIATLSPDTMPWLLEVAIDGDDGVIDDFVIARSAANEPGAVDQGDRVSVVREVRRPVSQWAPGLCDDSLSPATSIMPPLSPTTTKSSQAVDDEPVADDSRGAAANVDYVESLVANGELPFSSTVKSVHADDNTIVLTTSLTDEADATALWEALANHLGCDDTFLRVEGWDVILGNATVVDEPSPNFEYCIDS